MALTVRGAGGGAAFPKSLKVTTAPTKATYTAGDKLDLTGLVVTVTYSDNSTETVTCTASPAAGTVLYESTKSVTLSWAWPDDTSVVLTTDLSITVNRVLSSIALTAPTKTTYYKGDAMNWTGAKVTATFTSGATADVTSSTTFSPAAGAALSTFGTQTATASYTENSVTKTASTSIKVTAKVVTWSAGTDEEIVNMVGAADAGLLKLSDYWTVGDTRSISLSAMSATGVGESHAAQSADFVLMNAGGKTLTSGKTCSFVVGMKNCLKETGYMNSSDTSTTGWDKCARRTWCNSVFYDSIPSSIRGIFKKCKNVTASTGGNTSASLTTSEDYFALPAEKEIFGDGYGYSGKGYAANTEAASSDLSQFTWYATAANRIKQVNGSNSWWWERSPYGGYVHAFCLVRSDGSAFNFYASVAHGLAPFGCI
jgi:hypothetical protein